MDGLDAGVEEHLGEGADTAEALVLHLVVGFAVIEPGEAHDADELGAEALHSGDGSSGLREGGVEGVGDLLGPVGDGGAEAVDLDAGGLELAGGDVEVGVGEVMDVHAVDGAGLDAVPPQLLGRGDLAVQAT